jgi:hypothetical protein
MLPFTTLQKRLPRLIGSSSADFTTEQIALSVQRASRFVPRSTCLVQALATETLLRKQGELVQLKIGVAGGMKEMEAHAWVEKDGIVIIGNRVDLQKYHQLASFENGRIHSKEEL